MGNLRQSCVTVLVTVVSSWLPTSAVAEEPIAPCAACLVIVLDIQSQQALPASVEGMDVLVRVPAGGEAQVTAMLRAIRERGGRPGVLLDGDETGTSVLSETDTIVLAIAAGVRRREVVLFEAKSSLTALRAAAKPQVRIGVRASSDTLTDLLEGGAAPYFDFAISPDRPEHGISWWRDAGPLVSLWAAARSSGGAERSVWEVRGGAADVSRTLGDLTRAIAIFPRDLVADEGVGVSCEGRLFPTWLNPASFEVVSWVQSCQPASLTVAAPRASAAERYVLSSGDLLVRVAGASSGHFAERVDVRGAPALTVEEIVARHQAAAARQRAAIRTRIASGTMTLTFEAPGFAAPVTISARVTLYEAGSQSEIEHRAIRVNGLEMNEEGLKLPIVEPERVASPPLAIELTNVYRYALEGMEDLRGTACYVLAFEPADSRRPLFKGRAWIARESFALVRVSATQTNLRGAIVSSEQIDDFAPVEGDHWLLARSHVNQRYEGAAHRTPIERVLTFAHHEVNSPGFDERWTAARTSSSIMLRDTPQGYRYLRKPGDERPAGEDVTEPAVEPPATRVKTFVFGTIVDPNISHPLPFAGVSYVDFDLFRTGTQLNAFYGGTFGQLSFLVPSVGGTGWRVGGSAFAIASRFNDRAFHAGREHYDENIQQRPAQASVWLVRALTPRVSLRAGYDFTFTSFTAADSTAEAFVLPASQAVHAFRLAIDAQRGGWRGTVWWSPALRSGWRAWGSPERPDYRAEHADFQKYGVVLARTAIVSPSLVARAELAWMGGRDLDRFSRYSFGSFENRLHGYPSALIRYDRGAVVRGAAAWAASPRVRIDGFVDSAFVQDPGFGEGVQRFTGIGTAVEVPAPFGTLLAAEWGYGIQGRTADGSRGTHVVRVTAIKPF